ncbi:hypothetical protein [Kribbella sp. NPDC023855]|uniref:hypothetical protein n=1 Tax=Kribbella sp. NPDC023855 TaxID=3154698 RepID=UPI0033DF4378
MLSGSVVLTALKELYSGFAVPSVFNRSIDLPVWEAIVDWVDSQVPWSWSIVNMAVT